MPATSNTITQCSLCGGELTTVVELAATPPANELLTFIPAEKEVYPLNLVQCDACKHLQLDTEISKFRLFKNYVYTSNTSASNYSYFQSYAKEMKALFAPSFVVDIGSNDGLFLNFFKDAATKVLGVDPAQNIVDIARQNKIPTKCAFFNELVALDIVETEGKADLITSNNMFAHNRNLDEIVRGIKLLLSEHGTFVFEVSYAMSLLDHNLFDLIYHEHFHHWHLGAAIQYMKKFGLDVYDAELVPTHGGSIRIYVGHKGVHKHGKRASDILVTEGLWLYKFVDKFAANVKQNRLEVVSLLEYLKSQNKQISILGYPAKACTLSYYYGLDKTFITNIYDENPLKIGKYSHKDFLIKPATDIVKDKPDYLLLLSWNYKEELIKRFNFFTKCGGHFIVPFPKPEII